MTSVATSTSPSLNVRTSAVHFRCKRNWQPRASNAHPYTAVCTRRCGLTMQSESQTSCTFPLVLHQPMHTVRQQPAHTDQQSTTDVHTEAGGLVPNTAPRRSNDSRVHSSPKPDHCRAHSPRVSPLQLVQLARVPLPAIAGTPNRNERSARTRTGSSWLHTMHRNGAARMSQLLGRFSEIDDLNRV
jgi:hypothetical protein